MSKKGSRSVFAPLGASNHVSHEREKNDYYATDPIALELLLELERFSNNIWEPAAGEGHLSNVLKNKGYKVRESDLIQRLPHLEVLDFFEFEGKWGGDIITNPPYRKAQEFVEKSLDVLEEGGKLALFLKVLFLEGKRRKEMFKKHPPKKVWVSSSRLKCAINGDFDSVGSSATAYAWFIWEKGYQGETILDWFN